MEGAQTIPLERRGRPRKVRKAGVGPLDEIEAIVKSYEGIDAAGLIIQIQGVIEKQKGVRYE